MHQRIRVGSRSLVKQRARTKPTVMVAEQRGCDTPWLRSRERISERTDVAEAEKTLADATKVLQQGTRGADPK